MESRVEPLPADLWACSHLTRLELDLRHSAGLPAPAAPPNGAACLPALRELRLARCRLQGGALPAAVGQLTGLSRLEVRGCGLASSCTHAGLPQGLSRLSQLVSGTFSPSGGGCSRAPPCCACYASPRPTLRGLQSPAFTPPTTLRAPPGSRAQEHLSLEANALCTLPPALCTLPALRHLDLTCNQLVRRGSGEEPGR